ncbi:hydrogenase nickel incorporation protein HypB [Candidatus Fermentibacterales bacterium]|nr:hydrogenase nickel incorporation protein HypB [Candidatus Fermentibacterales bacterium]
MSDSKGRKTISVLSPVMEKNRRIAAYNRKRFDERGLNVLNLISSPGAGKTTLLEVLVRRFGRAIAVIEGDVQTERDAERIRAAGAVAYQIETHGACHLDAQRISDAFDRMVIPSECRILAIENVGNLICPSTYDLGEHLKIGLLSLPEGDDKVLKYPPLFSRVDLLVVTKMDLLPHMDFDPDRVEAECRSLNPDVRCFRVSARTGEGIDALCAELWG